MRINGKRIWALVLSLAILCTLLPAGTVLAAEELDYAAVDAVFELIDQVEAGPEKRNTTQEEKTEAAMQIVLASDSYVEDSLERSGNSFTWWTDSGIRCIYSPRMRKIRSEMTGKGEDKIENEPVATRGGTPEGNQVYLIGPYYGYDSNFTNQYKNEARRVAAAIGDTDGYTLYSGEAATIDKVAEAVSNGAVVFFDSHGTTDYENPNDEYDFITGATCSYMCLTSTAGLTTEDYEDGAAYDSEGAFVNGAAIANHMTGDSPNGLLWMAICLGMGTDGMYAPLRDKGVEVVYGYSESVTFNGDYLYEETFWEKMNTGSTVSEAVAEMKSKWGNWDWSVPIAEANGYNDGYATISEAREDFIAFPVVVSDEDSWPGQRTGSSYGADSLQNVQSTYSLGEVQEIVTPTDPRAILEEAYALGAGEELDYEATLTGKITTVTTAYNAQYGNVTVIMEVAGCEDMPIKCYRLEGSGADQIGVGDTITVTGTIVNYQHSSGDLEVEFAQGCRLVSWEDTGNGDSGSGDSGSTEPSDPFLPEGDISGSYYIAAQRNDVWFYMTNDLGTASNKRYQAEDTDMSSLPATIANPEAAKTFSVIDNGNGTYCISNEAGYLTWSAGNTGIFTSSKPEALNLDMIRNSDGTVSFTFFSGNDNADRFLSLNATAGNNYFAWYKAGQLPNLKLVPVVAGETVICQHENTTTTTVDATCTEDGSTTVTCDDCGATVSTTVIEAPGHGDENDDGICDTCQAELGTGEAITYVGVLMNTAPATGDVIFIGNGTNIMSDHASGVKMAYETGAIDGGTLTLTDTMAILEVAIDAEGYYTFYNEENHGYLTSAPAGNGLSFAEKSDYSLWTVESAGSGLFYIKNVNAAYNGNKNQSLEFYSGFTTYGHKDTAIYQMSLYKRAELSDDCQHTETTVTGAKEATCNLPGYTGDTVCASCGHLICQGEAIEAKGHTMVDGLCAVCGAATMVTAPEAGVAYKWGIEQNNLGKTLYFAGDMNGYYGATTDNYAEATDVYLEETEGGYHVTFTNAEGAKKYVNMVQSGEHNNFIIADAAETVYAYDAAYNTLTAALGEATCYIGTYGNYSTFSVSLYDKITNSFPTHFYVLDVDQGGDEPEEIIPMDAPQAEVQVNEATGAYYLTWNEDSNATAYEIYRATKKTGTYTLVDTVDGAYWEDASASVGKTYYYKVGAVNENEPGYNSQLSSPVSMTQRCVAPMVIAENDAESGRVALSWDKVNGAKKYDVYRATSPDGKYSKLTTTSKTSYTDTKGSVGVTYFYKVRAVASSSSYNSTYSFIVSGFRICATPEIKVKLDATTGKPVLSWDKVTGAVSYEILRWLPGESDAITLQQQTGLTYTDTTVPVDSYCEYMVIARGTATEFDSAVSEIAAVMTGLARVSVGGYTEEVGGKPVVEWSDAEGAVAYEVYRATKSSGTYKLVDTVEKTFYQDETASAGKSYYYKIVALGRQGRSAMSGYVKVACDCAQPELTVGVDAKTGKPKLSWNKISGAKKYEIYRASSEDGKYSKVTTTTKTSYVDKKPSLGKEYFYKIRAVASSSSYNSIYSFVESGQAVCAAPAVSVKVDSATGDIVVSWGKVSGADNYSIWRSEDVIEGGEMVEVAVQAGTKYIDTSVQAGRTYMYAVRALDEDDGLNSASGFSKTILAVCGKPALTGDRGESGKPELIWELDEEAEYYIVYRATSASGTYKEIHRTQDGYCEDTTAKSGKTYYYKIVAVAGDSKSAKSSYVKIKSK